MHCQLLLSALMLVAGQAVAPQPDQPVDLALQYARAKLQLAQTNLKRVDAINRRLARSVPASVVAEFQHDVAEADRQVAAASHPEQGEFGVWLRRAESNLQSAAAQWKNAVAANERLAKAKDAKALFDTLDVERFRLRAEVCRLQWERGKTLAAAPREAQLEWQIELLNNEVDRLKEDLPRVSPFIRYYPVYWFWY